MGQALPPARTGSRTQTSDIDAHRTNPDPRSQTRTQEVLDRRYDDVKSGRVKPIDGEEAFQTDRRIRNCIRAR